MFTKTLLMGAAASVAIASSVAAERGSDGNVSIIYWQAPSILNHSYRVVQKMWNQHH